MHHDTSKTGGTAPDSPLAPAEEEEAKKGTAGDHRPTLALASAAMSCTNPAPRRGSDIQMPFPRCYTGGIPH